MAIQKIPIGMLGGSFNPPHVGHIHISRFIAKKLGLQKVLWIISPGNPHKNSLKLQSLEKRLEQSKNLTKKYKNIYPTDIELQLFKHQKNKKFYTYNFLKRYLKKFPNHEINFIIGADNLINFHKWYRYKDILNLCNLIVLDREKYKYKALKSPAGLSGNYKFINTKKIDISSTGIRNKSKKPN